jgi:excisionase family DNA binding protein
METEQLETDTTPMLGDEPQSRRERARTSLLDRLSRPSPTIWPSGQEAAEYVGVSWPTLRQAIIEFGIPHVRLGRRWKIEVAVLDEHLRRMARA